MVDNHFTDNCRNSPAAVRNQAESGFFTTPAYPGESLSIADGWARLPCDFTLGQGGIVYVVGAWCVFSETRLPGNMPAIALPPLSPPVYRFFSVALRSASPRSPFAGKPLCFQTESLNEPRAVQDEKSSRAYVAR